MADRHRFFQKAWKTVFLELEDRPGYVEVNVGKPSSCFWGECGELIHCEIREWFQENNLHTWSRGKPHKLVLEPVSERHFKLHFPKRALQKD
jgi:hypothetical protein